MKKTAASNRLNVEMIEQFQIPHDGVGLSEWVISAAPGSALAYYRGSLAHDRTENFSKLRKKTRQKLNLVATYMMLCVEQRLVHLVQVRCGRDNFLYVAVRSSRSYRNRNRAIRSFQSTRSVAAEAA